VALHAVGKRRHVGSCAPDFRTHNYSVPRPRPTRVLTLGDTLTALQQGSISHALATMERIGHECGLGLNLPAVSLSGAGRLRRSSTIAGRIFGGRSFEWPRGGPSPRRTFFDPERKSRPCWGFSNERFSQVLTVQNCANVDGISGVSGVDGIPKSVTCLFSIGQIGSTPTASTTLLPSAKVFLLTCDTCHRTIEP
jgi:hypothetical protein